MSYADPVDEQQHFSKGSTPLLQRRTYGTVGSEPATRNSGLRRPPEIDIVWKNISYKVPEGKNGPLKTVINNVSGEARCGQLCAFMGSSGAGKTTLLDVLASRVEHPENVDGVIELNNVPLDRAILRKVSSYVIQEERLPEAFTVHETFTFYASLRLPKSMSVYEKSQIVDELIEQLSLTKARDTPIGGSFFRGVSGGEKRRVSIGIELVTRPGLIFLDEPTTGLDSNSSYTVISILKKLAHGGRTIITSVHQPRPDIFFEMDTLMLLSEGETFYFGPIDRCKEYFSGIGFECPSKMNPADYILDVVTPGADIVGYNRTLTIEEIRQIRQKYPTTPIGKEMSSKVNTQSQYAPLDVAKQTEDLERPSTMDQVKLLIWRNITNFKRNPIEIQARIASAIFQAFLGGLVLFDQSESTAGVRGRVSALFYAVTAVTVSSIGELVQVFPLERDLVVHERRSSTYSIFAYFLSRMITDRIPVVILPVFFSLIFYFMVNLRDGFEHFAKFYLVIFIAYNSAQSLSLLIGSMVPNVAVGTVFGPFFGVIFMLFSGYLINIDEIPDSLSWLCNFSPVRWSMQALSINEFEDVEYEDDTPTYGCGYENGNDVIEDYDYDGNEYSECIVYSIIIFLFFTVALFISLYIRDRRTVKYV